MGFAWVQNIGIGADIDSADIVEIRDAADFVLDNLCVADNVGENVGEDGLDLNAEDGVENSDDNPAENGVENSDDNPALNGTDNALEDDAALGANEGDCADCGSDLSDEYAPVYSDENDTAHPDNTFVYFDQHAADVTDEYAGDDNPHKSSI